MKSARLIALSILLITSWLSACSVDIGTPAATSTASPAADLGGKTNPPATPTPGTSTFDLRMSRSGCFGRCPSYTVEVSSDGNVKFQGQRFVAATGEQQGEAVHSSMQALRELLADPAVMALTGDYTPANAKACGQWYTDAASISIDITEGAFPRQIKHYLGCEGAPKLLRTLEKAIDDAAGVDRWIGGASSQ